MLAREAWRRSGASPHIPANPITDFSLTAFRQSRDGTLALDAEVRTTGRPERLDHPAADMQVTRLGAKSVTLPAPLLQLFPAPLDGLRQPDLFGSIGRRVTGSAHALQKRSASLQPVGERAGFGFPAQGEINVIEFGEYIGPAAH